MVPARGRFRAYITEAHLINYPVENHHILNASFIIESLPSLSLRTLDALHLTIANDIPVESIATSDKVMGEAAQLLDSHVFFFG